MLQDKTIDTFLGELVEKYRKEAGLFLITLIFAGGIFLSFLFSRQNKRQGVEIKNTRKVLPVTTALGEVMVFQKVKVVVDVAGAVGKPGVYELEEGSRVEAAIDAAGGFSEQADLDFVARSVNLAQILSDGEKIYIPTEEEIQKGQVSTLHNQVQKSGNVAGLGTHRLALGGEETQVSGKININAASQSELESLPGIGPVYAQRIIEGRPFSTVEEIMRVKGIGSKTFEKIKDRIVVK